MGERDDHGLIVIRSTQRCRFDLKRLRGPADGWDPGVL